MPNNPDNVLTLTPPAEESMRYTCDCGSEEFHLLQGGEIECMRCGHLVPEGGWYTMNTGR